MSDLIVDAGPLVAYLCPRDLHHEWAVAQFEALTEPVLTCEPVWTEAMHLISKYGGDPEGLWAFVRRRVVSFAFDLRTDCETVAALMRRYSDIPMSLADACLVRMSELHRDGRVWTVDRDFRFYRRFGRQMIPMLAPF